MQTQHNNFSNVQFVPAYILLGDSFKNPIFTSVSSDNKSELADGIYQDENLQNEDEKGILDYGEKFYFVHNGYVFRAPGEANNYKHIHTEKTIKGAITKLKNRI